MRHGLTALCCLAVIMVSTPAGAAVLSLHVSCGLPRGEGNGGNVARGTFHGRTAIRFRLDKKDIGQCPADVTRGNYNRAELRSDDLPRNRTVRIAFDVFIPTGFPATGGVVIGQFHQRGRKPLTLLMASDKDYRVNPGSGLRALGAAVIRRAPLFASGAYGRWHAIVMEGRFVRSGGGAIRVFADGALRFEATGRTVETEPYFKIGLYARRDRIAGPLIVDVTPPTVTIR